MVIMYCLDDESFERMSEEKDIESVRWISPNFHIETTSEFHQKGWDALMWNKNGACTSVAYTRIQCAVC